MSGTEEQAANKRREITLSLGPMKMTLRGYDVLLTLLLCAVVGLLVGGWYHTQAVAEDKQENNAQHKSIMAKQDKQEEQLSELTYVLTLSQEKREALGLQMPDSLRKKLRVAP